MIRAKAKKRPRSHIIADLSVNYVERYALKCGFSVEIFAHDYGYDLNVYTYNSKREAENGSVFMQLKASDSLKIKGNFIHFSLDKRDINRWINEVYPAILVLYDAKTERAYWLYIQEHFSNILNFDLSKVRATYTVHINISKIIDIKSMKEFRIRKNSISTQLSKIPLIR